MEERALELYRELEPEEREWILHLMRELAAEEEGG